MMVNAVSRYHQTYDLLEVLTLLNHWTDKLHKKNGQSNVMVPYVTHTLRHKVRFGKSSHAILSTTKWSVKVAHLPPIGFKTNDGISRI